MVYRLICIYKVRQGHIYQLDIEVCKDTHSSTLSPFIRKVSTEDLCYSQLKSPLEIVLALNQLGMDRQPFLIDGKILENGALQQLLKENPWNYKQEKSRGSIKKTRLLLPIPSSISLSCGHLLYGELYISNLSQWKNHIKIRLVYENALIPFYPLYNVYPCQTIDRTIFVRDKMAEEVWLQDVRPYMEGNGLEMSLPDYDVNFLRDLERKGWKFYVEGKKGSRSEVYGHQSHSGIIWFDRNENIKADECVIRQLLDGYLQGRNYVEVGKDIQLFRSHDITHQKSEVVVEELGDDGSVLALYSQNIPLTNVELQNIDQRIMSSVNAHLRPYQLRGVIWLAEMRKNHKGCLLADEMGLGKTLQILAHLYCIENVHGPFLVVVPTSLIYNWENEVKKFIPAWKDRLCIQSHVPQHDCKIILVSYDILRLNLKAYCKEHYDTIVIDEAQIIKNRDTKKYQAIKKLTACHRIILTGTPIENSINDIWSHFMILMPPMRGIFKTITKEKVSLDSPEFVELSKKFMQPFILRRTKQQVLKDLPARIEKNVYIMMTDKECTIYNNVKAVFLAALKTGISGRLNSIALEGLLRLRQACVSPNLLPSTLYRGGKMKSSKVERALDYIGGLVKGGNKVLVFSQFVSILKEMEEYLQEMCISYVHLYGDTLNRKKVVEEFQHNRDVKVFLISLKAGGVGLNLTAANRVILMDDWWNPAVEDQAFSRAHRIGQRSDVMIFRLICKNTVEEKILLLQEKKKQTVDLFNAGGNKLTMEELKGLIE